VAAPPPTDASEYRRNYRPLPGVTHEAPPLRPSDLKLDGHLLFAHGTLGHVTDRGVPGSNYSSVTQSQMMGTAMATTLGGTAVGVDADGHYAHATAATHAGPARHAHKSGADAAGATLPVRTELMQSKARMRAAGVDWHDPQPMAARVASVPMTVTPKFAGTLVGEAAPKREHAYQPLGAAVLSSTATLTQTAQLPVPGQGHGRNQSFTKQFSRGIGSGARA
jgi:hypothetical protein